MSHRLVITQEAETDIRASLIWYKLRSPLAAARFLVALDECYSAIRRSPISFQIERGRIRQVPVRRFPFKIYFEVVDGTILILRVYHLKHDERKRFTDRGT